MPSAPPLFSPRFQAALDLAAGSHAGQTRRGNGIPYLAHVVAVAWILERAGFGEDVVIAGLLHDSVEDTDVTLDAVRARFGPAVSELVGYCSEIKSDEHGRKRPWIDRKRDHLAALADAPIEARAVTLADKLHNLRSIRTDLEAGRPIWSQFNADRASVLWYQQAMIDLCGAGDPRLVRMAAECREVLDEVRSLEVPC